MKKLIIDKKKYIRTFVTSIFIIGSALALYFWTPDFSLMGSYLLYRVLGFICALSLVFIIYAFFLISQLSKKYPKRKVLLRSILTLLLEAFLYAGIFAVLIRFDFLHIDIYTVVLFVAILLFSMFQKIEDLSEILEVYRNNSRLGWKNLILNMKKESFRIWYTGTIVFFLLLIPVAVWINASFGISFGVIMCSFLFTKMLQEIT